MVEIKNFGVCNVTVAPVRATASDTAEIVTQLLFGDYVEIIEKGQPWIKIKFHEDAYEGWMDFKQLTYISDNEYQTYKNSTPTYLSELQLSANGPKGKQHLLLASSLPNLEGNTVSFGGDVYTLDKTPTNRSETLLDTALKYLNAPYLWGGKSLFGIDCSGFVQNVFKIHGLRLPRDASQQVHKGKDIAFEDREPGDVPFFINAKGNVHHVGILTDKDTIIHAAGCVRADPFDEKGIYREDLGKYTHNYHSIKRYA